MVAGDELIDLLERLRAGRTQSEWAEELGVSQASVSQWLAGLKLPNRAGLTALLKGYPAYTTDLIRLIVLNRSDETTEGGEQGE